MTIFTLYSKLLRLILSLFFSKDCVNWGLLPPATKQMRDQSKLAKGRFTGDPSFEFEHVETKKVGEGEDATEEEETVPIYFLIIFSLSVSKKKSSYSAIVIVRSSLLSLSLCKKQHVNVAYCSQSIKDINTKPG